MDYKAIFSDVDGTLINSRFEITPGTKAEILRCVGQGVPFTTVSARSGPAMLPIRRYFTFPAYQIIFSGALVENEKGEVLLSCPLTADQVERVYRAVEECPGILATCYTREDWFVPEDDGRWVPFEADCTELTPIYGRRPSAEQTVYKFLLMGEEQATDRAVELLGAALPDLTVYKSSRFYIEVLSGSASKSKAIDFLLGQWGISPGEIIAFGDSYNDIDMLEYAGLGVAMGNAPAAVKASADAVTASNDEEGLAAGLRRYVGA